MGYIEPKREIVIKKVRNIKNIKAEKGVEVRRGEGGRLVATVVMVMVVMVCIEQ